MDDIVELLPINADKKIVKDYKIHKKQNLGLAFEEEKVYSEVGLRPKCLTEIVDKCGFSTAKTAKILLHLEMSGLIQQTEKNFYVMKI